jgi:hypothetical protein
MTTSRKDYLQQFLCLFQCDIIGIDTVVTEKFLKDLINLRSGSAVVVVSHGFLFVLIFHVKVVMKHQSLKYHGKMHIVEALYKRDF